MYFLSDMAGVTRTKNGYPSIDLTGYNIDFIINPPRLLYKLFKDKMPRICLACALKTIPDKVS